MFGKNKAKTEEDVFYDNDPLFDENLEDKGSGSLWDRIPALGKEILFAVMALVLVAVVALVMLRKPGDAETAAHQHVWSEATCTSPRICVQCDVTEGSALGHRWQPATYLAPATCSACGETTGEPLPPTEAPTQAPAEAPAVGYPLIRCAVIKDSNNGESKKDVCIGTWEDTHGIEHPDAIRFWVADFGDWVNSEYITYDLGGSYSRLELTIAPEESSEPGTRGKVLVYSGNDLLYESGWVSVSDFAIQATVDISGCDEIMILCETDSSDFYYGIVEAMLYP